MRLFQIGKNYSPRVGILTMLALLMVVGTLNAQTPENRFEKNVQAYEAADKTTPPPKNAILLVGDSQLFRWKTLGEDLPDFTIINRGIDSFQFSDILHFIDLWDAMLTKEGQPREELWVADGVHPNHDGYLVRVKIMRPLLGKPDKKAR